MTNSKTQTKPIQIIVILGIGLLLTFGFKFGLHYIKQYSQQLDLQQEATLLEREIINHSFEGVDKILSSIIENQHIINALKNKTNQNDEANAVLSICNQMAHASISYVMDTLGNVCLSTTFQNNLTYESLLGKNYSFRPYFKRAIKGESPIYPAVGITTNVSGIYFSKPIYNEEQVIGVAVIKINTEQIQNIIDLHEEKILIISPEGIVFISNEKEWLFRTINFKKQLSVQKLNTSKQFYNKNISALPFKLDCTDLRIDEQDYILNKRMFNDQNWQIVVMTPINWHKPLNSELKKIIIVAFVLILILLLSIALLVITNRARKIAKQSIVENQEDLRITLESIGDGVITTNEKGQITRLNPIACKLLEAKEEDTLGKAFEQVIKLRDEKNRQLINDPLSEIRNKPANYSATNIRLLMTNSGQQIPISETASTIGNKHGLVIGYVFVYQDISKIYDLKQKLQENQFHLRKIIDCIPQSISIVNEEGYLLLNNKGFEELTGINSKLLNNKKQSSLYSQSEYFKQSRSINQELINTDDDQIIPEDQYTDINGETHIFHTKKIAFNYYNQKAVLTVSSDISQRKYFQDKLEIGYKDIANTNRLLVETNKELKTQQEALIKAKQIAEHSSLLKTNFLQNLAYRIKTPLNELLNFKTLEKCKEEALNTFKNSEHLLLSIEELIEISNIETKALRLSKKTILPTAFIEELHENYNLGEAKHITFKMDFEHAEKSFNFISDTSILTKIINHLLSNAFKNTPEGEVTIGCHSRQDYITFFVKDTGVGMDKEKQTAILEHLTGIKEGGKSSSHIGLGLITAKLYTGLIHGSIWLESQQKKGTTFYVKLPVCF